MENAFLVQMDALNAVMVLNAITAKPENLLLTMENALTAAL